MIQRLKENTWIKFAAAALALIAILSLWSWLAGCVFMLVNKTKPSGVWPQTYWTYVYYYHAEHSVMRQLVISAGLPLAVSAFAIAALLQKKRSLHGEARFANRREVAASGLLASKGIIVGKSGGRFLMSDGPHHILLAAPTRSGKGVGVVIPNLLNWADSVVVLDIKQENWDLTAGFREKHGQQCFLFNPAARDYRTHRWNPLAYVSTDEHFRVDDLQKIGSMLWSETQGNEGFWDQLAGSLFLGISLMVMDSPELTFTLGECLRQSMKSNLQKRFMKIIAQRRKEGRPLPSQCVNALTAFAGRSENTTASILSTYQAKLNIWLNPVVDAATSANDFDLRDLRRKPMSIYLGITPDNLARLAPVINLFFQQVIDLQMRKLPQQDPTLKYQVLMLMDEFTAMGKVGILAESIAYVAGYGLRLLPIVQSSSQLVDRYGQHQAENFIENHAVRIVFAPESIKIAKELSETLGYQTVKSTNTSKQVGLRAKPGLHNESESDQRRALLLPQELMTLGLNKEIIFSRGTKPILANKVIYYKAKLFNDRLCIAPAVPILVLETARVIADVEVEECSAELPTTRDFSVSDLPNIDSISLDQFSCDFSDIEIPTDPISDADVEKLADAYFDRISTNSKETA
jgi:type IV secretion system protein VirD4